MLKLKKSLAGLLLLLSASISAQFSIKGTVRKQNTNERIAGATVNIQGSFITLQSNSDGSFEFNDLKKGTYRLHTSFIGYLTKTDTIIINENNESEIAIELKESPILMDEIIVSATRIDERAAVAFSELSKQQIEEQNLGQDLPYLLNQLPSIVTTSDAGAGVGYTAIRMRGIDATRINVTINGIPLNDAESQGTFWVDLPDIASSIDNIQVQRGVGTSTNGAGAFGGSLNIQTTKLNPKGYGEYNTSWGSFNTFKNTVNVGSGLINDKFSFDARLSKISSDGFIDRAASDLKSYYLSGAYYGKKSIIKFITFSGLEETYQAWNGIPESRLKGDVQGMNDYIIRNALSQEDALHLLNSESRTFNQFTYQNQVDHYKQDYYQLHFSHEFNRKWNMNLAMHFTKGKGYFEEYKKGEAFSNFGLNDIYIGVDTITQTNLVRRKWLDNNFYGTTFSTSYNSNKKLNATIGGAWNKYDGLHYGEVIWAQYATNSTLHNNYYKDTASKIDFNIFAKMNFALTTRFSFYTDLQYRIVNYSFLGYDNNLKNIQQSASLGFINPKIGFNFELNSKATIYLSYSVGNKEPSRDDYTQSTLNSRPKAETLSDIELGYRKNSKNIKWTVNAYYMEYKNQLILTGEINDVGAYNRTNVLESYRNGLEAEIAIRIFKNLTWNMNATFSQNKINNYVEYLDNFDSTAQRVNNYSKTDIAFSPNIIAAGTLTFEPIKNLKFNFICKYVGKQYMDNTHVSAYNAGVTPTFIGIQHRSETEKDTPMLDAYFTGDLRINYTLKTKYIREIGITFTANNILNELYESNGYTYGYIYGGDHVVENFYYPQAGMNFTAGLSFKF